MMFNPAAYENSRPDGVGVLEIKSGPEAPEGQPRRFVPLKRTELRGEVVGPLASLRVVHVYRYSNEEYAQVLEAVYRFPLPGDAAVTGLRVQFGDVEIRTELKERPEAEAEYEEARRQGNQAALLSRESPDVFTLQVAGIQPDQDVIVETSYVQLGRAEGAGWSLRVPLTTAPRYVRSDELTSRHAQGQPLFLLRDPGHRFSLDVNLFGAGSVNSPTHGVTVSPEGDHVRVRLREGEVVPDRDCVLSWQPEQEGDRPTFHLWLHDDRATEQVYFLALLAPPAARDPDRFIPREVILLVDHSGSMTGPKWAATDWAVKKFLSELSERDTFALGLFHNQTRWFAKTTRRADAGTIEDAIHFLERHTDSGGTELGVALEQALHLKRAEGDTARHVLVITDAEVSDTGRVLQLADQEAQREDRRRISDLCIDAAPNSFLALELAERGGGIARFLTSDPEQEDISTALDEVLADWAQPVLTGLQLEINRPEVQAAGRAVLRGGEDGTSRIDLADLPAGRTRWIVGRVPRGVSTDLTFRVLSSGGREVKSRRLDLAGETHTRPALKALFAARRLLGLELLIHSGYTGAELDHQLRRLGYDPEKVQGAGPDEQPMLYAENAREERERALRRLLVEESLAHGLICSETAFVAVRTEHGKPIEGTVAVANALPAGWSESFLASGLTGGVMRRLGFRGPARGALGFRDAGVQADSLLLVSAAPASSPETTAPKAQVTVLFAGVPRFDDGEAVLFDSARAADAGRLPDGTTISSLQVRFPGGTPEAAGVDRGLSLLLFLDDLSQPRARVKLTDLIRQAGERPLNLMRRPGQRVRIVLTDPAGAWAHGGPTIEVALG
jgi:Ca-activated chloride channel family protein